jgi:hypothetical protein
MDSARSCLSTGPAVTPFEIADAVADDLEEYAETLRMVTKIIAAMCTAFARRQQSAEALQRLMTTVDAMINTIWDLRAALIDAASCGGWPARDGALHSDRGAPSQAVPDPLTRIGCYRRVADNESTALENLHVPLRDFIADMAGAAGRSGAVWDGVGAVLSTLSNPLARYARRLFGSGWLALYNVDDA